VKGVGRFTTDGVLAPRRPDIWQAADLALRRRVERMTIAIIRVKRASLTRPIGLAAAAVVIGPVPTPWSRARCLQR
jgi:hypothetical protein